MSQVMANVNTSPKVSLSASQAASVAASLASTSLFRPTSSALHPEERSELSFQRAKAIARAYGECCDHRAILITDSGSSSGLTPKDILFLRSKFWALHSDQICSMDGTAATLLTTQYNLVAGTLVPHATQRPELQPLLQQILDFDVS